MKRTLFCLLVSTSCFAAVNVPLTVQETLYTGSMAGLPRSNEPVTVGVPLPDSAGITSTNVLGLTGATAAQFTVESRWPDGNIKWVKVRAIVPSVSAGGTATITLTDSGSGDFGGAGLATDSNPGSPNSGTITIATGSSTFTVKKANFNVVDQVLVGAATVVTSGASTGLVVLGPDPKATYPGNVTCLPTAGGSPCTTVYSTANDPTSSVVIEENGPAVAVLKATADLNDGAGHIYMHVTVREYFWKGESYVKLTTSLRNADYGTTNTFATAFKGIQGFELRLKPALSGPLSYALGNHTGSPTAGTMSATDEVYLYQAESNAMKPPTWCNGHTGCVPFTTLSGYSILKNGAPLLTGTAAQYPQGWADISDASGKGVEIGQYQLAGYGNKSLEFRGGGTDVRVGLWASENNTTSTSTTTSNAPYYLPWPQYSIHETYLNFHAAAPASLPNDFLKLQHYLIARAPLAHYNSTGVFPYPLLDPTEETNYYNSVKAAASPAIGNTFNLGDIGANAPDSLCTTALCVFRFYPWSDPGGANQMEFRLSRLYNWIRRGYTGSYLSAANFYKMESELTWPLSDGFSWRTHAMETNQMGIPTAVSANSNLGMHNTIELDQEHANAYGIIDYYFMSGDQTYLDTLTEGVKDLYLSNTGSSYNLMYGYNGTNGGVLWNQRAVGNMLLIQARLSGFFASIGDPEASSFLTQADQVYTSQVSPPACMSGYLNGAASQSCGTIWQTFWANVPAQPGQKGISRERGAPFQWGQHIVAPAGCGYDSGGVRAAASFQNSILIQGILEYRNAKGPGWAGYTTALDLAYGLMQWQFGEMLADNGSNSWIGQGFRYYEFLDVANACNSAGEWQVENEETQWFPFYVKTLVEGNPANWKRIFDEVLQQNLQSTTTDEFGHYTIGNLIYLQNHPPATVLSATPITGFVDNGGGSYTVSWTVPAGAVSYRIKWGPKAIVNYIGFNGATNTFIGNPATTMNWFAATEAAGIPAPGPAGTTQSLTVTTGVTGLTAANFMVKTYVPSGSGSPPPPPAPTVTMTAPAGGATLSGTVTLSASASDPVAMTGVQFQLDGAKLGNLIAGPGPSFSTSWDTTTAANGAHVLSAALTDSANGTAVSGGVSVTVNNATAAPVVSNVTATSITASGATITWQTDQPADSQVMYGPTNAYGSGSPLAAGLVLQHSVTLSGLTGSSTYHFKATSHNAQGTLGSSGDFTFSTSAPPSGGGTPITLNNWTSLTPHGYPGQVFGYDKSVYVNSRQLHCVWGGYHQTISSEPNEATVCYSYAENRWFVMQNNGMWHSDHVGQSGHSNGVWAYMPDRDTIVGYTDGTGSSSPEPFLGHWWWFDVAGLSGEDKEFSPRPWMSATTPAAAMVYDTANAKLVLFPDSNGGMQVCDPATNSCSGKGSAGGPPRLGSLSMAYNSTNHKVYVFGGGGNDIYTFDAATNIWAKLAPTCTGADCTAGKPPVRIAAGFAYSSKDNVFLMAGGSTPGFNPPAFTDTWIFDPVAVSWTELTPASRYANGPVNTTFDRLTYDPDSNVFVMMASGGAADYADGLWNSYSAQIWAYAYSPASNYGRVSNTYTPPAGSLNRLAPASSTQSWAFDPAITASGSSLYAGWIETGSPFDTSSCGLHHPYIQSANNTTWTPLPGGTQAAACASIDAEPAGSPGNSDDSKLRLTVAGGTLWEAHEKWNLGAITSSAWAKSWNGSAWVGGQVGCFTAACSGNLTQNPQALIANGNTPTLAVIEYNHIYVAEAYVYVAQWNGGSWAALGGKLNVNTSGTRALFATLATDGSNPAACWSEEVDNNGDRMTVTTTPQIQCAQWNGSAWSRWKSLNQSASSWAYSPTMTYVNGKFYVSWTERTTAGVNKLYACRWDGSSCTLLGGGPLNTNLATGWAVHPSLSNDGTNVYLAWEEQLALGQHSMGYVKQWNGSAWSSVGGVLNADPINGSVEGISLAVVQGHPTAIWGEIIYGNLRQVYVKQWNGSAWVGASGSGTPPPPTQLTCDLNGDGTVNAADVQIAINQALGLSPCSTADLQQNGQCSVIDVQRIINASLGGVCMTGH
jgi:hypothetical protein